ncbi:UbiA family prenyltransferase [Rhizobium sp. AAP43]|uniref:UbiA family prenyltransferase n=1 Tax=Rhizobium sp. AAP43 TaxID=1523420 RepID=UPI000AB16F69|nr:UbiA family prenyltransferase [Rhizobium sp. AAP43]
MSAMHSEFFEEIPILVVDLDGTLLRSDLLFESFWSALGRDWKSPFLATAALKRGKAALKRHLAEAAEIDIESLPYDTAVIERVSAWRAQGGRTALVTASDQGFADAIAAHLDLFDEVHGSDGLANLKSDAKAQFLAARYGAAGYVYMGDTHADLPVWQGARKAITVNASSRVRTKADALGVDIEHMSSILPSIRPYLKALRPHQWLKNLLVFLPMFAAHQLDLLTFAKSLLAFIAFSLVASSVYIVNDLLDLSADRAHPRKRNRPFASGSIPIAHGTWMAIGLLALGTLTAGVIGLPFLGVMTAYFIMTTAYSLHLKRRLIIDICVLAGLYTVRIVAGGAATGIPLSVWLLAFSIFFFFSLAAVKRQAELVDGLERGEAKASGRGYYVDDLPIISMIALSSGYVSVLVMALYVNSPAVSALYSRPEALWAICCILLYWITRMVMMTHRGSMHDDPVVYAAKDKISLCCIGMVAVFGLAGAVL